MLLKKFTAVAAASSIFCAVSAANSNYNTYFSEENDIHTVNFYNFEVVESTDGIDVVKGTIMQTLEVKEGETIDYSLVDTSALSAQIDDYTQIRFSSWSETPETVTENIDIYALYQMAVLSVNAEPERREYFSNEGDISLSGLDVTITVTTQTPEKVDGDHVVTTDVLNITSLCTVQPSTLSEAFYDSITSEISVYCPPIPDTEHTRPLLTYSISLFENLGDVNGDSSVNAVDATEILKHYAQSSVSDDLLLTDEQIKCADIDRNGEVNPVDATKVLQYYAMQSLDSTLDWEKFLNA